MAVQPLFIENMEVLRQHLKLSSASQPDTAAAIDNATRRVRAMIYDRLGSEAVVRILGYTSTDNPTTTNDLRRTRAEMMEADWVKLVLLRDLPTLFMDGSENVNNRWNDEELTREASSRDLKEWVAYLEEQIADALADLLGEDIPGKVIAFVPAPDTTPPRPGDSVRYPYGARAGVII